MVPSIKGDRAGGPWVELWGDWLYRVYVPKRALPLPLGDVGCVNHIPKRERKHALRDVYAMEPVAPKFNPWSSCPITFDRRDHPTSIRHGGFAALVLDPIIDGFHLTRVLMDGGSFWGT